MLYNTGNHSCYIGSCRNGLKLIFETELKNLQSLSKAYIFTIFILIGFCFGIDTPTKRQETTEKVEKDGNVTILVSQYEEKIAATEGSNSKPLLETLPTGSITGRNRITTAST